MKPRKYFWLAFAVLLVASFARTTPAQTPSTTPAAPSPTPADGVTRITIDELEKALLAGKPQPFVIDVRLNAAQKIKGAATIPFGDIETRLNEIPRDRAIVTYCA
jgi:hypothetical protein